MNSGSFLPALHPGNQKSCFQKSVMQYVHLTLNAIQFAQHLPACLLEMCAFHTAYACYKCVRNWQKNNFPDSYRVRVKHQDFILSLMGFLKATSANGLASHLSSGSALRLQQKSDWLQPIGGQNSKYCRSCNPCGAILFNIVWGLHLLGCMWFGIAGQY